MPEIKNSFRDNCFSSKTLVFVAGVEGSGTTMLLKVLDNLEECVAMGGNYFPQYVSDSATRLNSLTRNLWSYPAPDLETREKIKQKIRNIEVPTNYQFIAYKRSYPFVSNKHFPQLSDLPDFSQKVKVIVMTRYFKENVLSILRRGFEKDTNMAIDRIAKGYKMLTRQILSNPGLDMIEIKYENIIDEEKKEKILLKIHNFLEKKPENLETLKAIIKSPKTHI